jgi:hypothetical protein
VGNDIIRAIAKLCVEARVHNGTKEGFGRDFQVILPLATSTVWSARSATLMQDMLDQIRSMRKTTIGQKREQLLDDVCQEQPQDSEPTVVAPKRRRIVNDQRTGARVGSEQTCHFGHQTTSSRRGTRSSWHTNPEPSFWQCAPSGCILCSKCYQLGYRQRRDGLAPTAPIAVDVITASVSNTMRPVDLVQSCRSSAAISVRVDDSSFNNAHSSNTAMIGTAVDSSKSGGGFSSMISDVFLERSRVGHANELHDRTV